MTAPLLTPKYSAREPISSYVCCIATKFSITDISELGWNYTKVIIPGQGWRQVLYNRDASFPDAGIWIFVTISSIIHILSSLRSALERSHLRARNFIFSSCISLLDRKTSLPGGIRGSKAHTSFTPHCGSVHTRTCTLIAHHVGYVMYRSK